MAHREEWGVVNYGQRGRRGYPGRGVTSIQLDSEGYLWAYYTDFTSEGIGHIPMGEPGEKGEPGENGRVVDVFVNGTSVVNSEGFAYIDMGSEGPTYEAGENIVIENNVISAVDTIYFAGENISIDSENVISSKDTLYFAGENVSIDSENVISAIDTKYSAGENIIIDSENVISAAYEAGENITISEGVISAIDTKYSAGEGITIDSENVISAMPYEAGENITISEGVISAVDTKYTAGENIVIDSENVISSPMLIDKVITVTENVGGYVQGDTIPADTPIRQIIETILAPAPRPVPPQENLFFWGVWGSRTSGPPTGIDTTWASEVIEPAVIQRDGIIKYFTTRKQYECIAFPVDMPDLVSVYENDLPFNVLNGFTKTTCEYNGVTYKLYYNQLTQEENAKYQFMWR